MTMYSRTPVRKHHLPSGAELHLKMECFQPVGSFKIRGIGHLCCEAVEAGAAFLVSSSGGNAGYAVAFAGWELGVPVTVVVPTTTPPEVRHKIGQLGATVEVYGAVWDETHQRAQALAESSGGCYVPPFDHPSLWAGHATLIHEYAADFPRPDGVVVAVGGGGLLCGVAAGLRDVGWENTPMLAVETEGAASLSAAVAAGRLVSLEEVTSIAKSLGAKQVALQALTEAQHAPVKPLQVSDASAVEACVWFADEYRVLVEPACGAALAAARDLPQGIWLVVVCGGIGVSLEQLRQWTLDLSRMDAKQRRPR